MSEAPELSVSDSNGIETEIDPFESIQEWLNQELGGKTDLEPEFRSESPIFDDWDDISYDSNEEDDLDFLNDLPPTDKSVDEQSIPGSEGYGTDTSDLNDLLNYQPSSLKSQICVVTPESTTAESKKTIIEVSKTAKDTNKVLTFTRSQTVCSAKSSVESSRPRIISLKDGRIQGALIPKEGKITRVYQIPTIKNSNTTPSTIASKVGTQSRKTVVVKVLKPKNG